MGYRPPSAEPVGKWAKAIHAKRRADGISQTKAFELLRVALKLGPKSRSAYIDLDMGNREPRPDEEAVLVAWLGKYPEDTMTGAGSDTTVQPVPVDLVDALAAQTAAISALAAQVKALAEAQPTGEELANVLAAAVALAVRETLRAAGVVDGTPPK